jgi:hypothetical protein
MTDDSPGLIKPFNLDPADYEAMYHGPLPARVTISINTLTTDAVTYGEMDKMRFRIKDVFDLVLNLNGRDPLGILRQAPSPIFAVEACVHPHLLTADILAMFAAEQKAWMINGAYHQVAFHTEPDDISQEAIHDGTGLAMTMLDYWVCMTGSHEPSDHQPIKVGSTVAEDYNGRVSGLYASGAAFWCEKLISMRNEILTVIHSADLRENVFASLEAFRASGKDTVFSWT